MLQICKSPTPYSPALLPVKSIRPSKHNKKIKQYFASSFFIQLSLGLTCILVFVGALLFFLLRITHKMTPISTATKPTSAHKTIIKVVGIDEDSVADSLLLATVVGRAEETGWLAIERVVYVGVEFAVVVAFVEVVDRQRQM